MTDPTACADGEPPLGSLLAAPCPRCTHVVGMHSPDYGCPACQVAVVAAEMRAELEALRAAREGSVEP